MNRRNSKHDRQARDVKQQRRGAVLPTVAVFTVILLIMAAFAIDVAYMELVKTQLRAASDSAAKAGTSALVQGQSSDQAVATAINMASLNTVAGHPLILSSSDIVLGQSVQQSDGTWQFVAGVQPYQAVQVNASLSSQNANGSVPLFFSPFMGVSSYSPTNTSVASAFACEVCLVLDRSQSMCWDQSGTQNSYPAPVYSNMTLGIQTPPLPGSRWMALDAAVGVFCNILSTANAPPRVAVVTWSSDIGTSTMDYQLTGQTAVAASTDLQLTTDMSDVYSVVHNRSQNVMLGATNMAAGIDQGTSVLTGSNVRPYAKKVMILMTDGQWNTGNNPIDSATTAVAQGITIHCICFLQTADQSTTQQIASMSGGKFYYATDSTSLNQAFSELAYALPVVLTQ